MSTDAFRFALVLRNTGSRVLATILGQGAKSLVAILVARTLGPAAFGLFSVVWTITSLATYYAPMGVDQLLIREQARDDPRIDLRHAVPLVLTISTVTAGLLVGGAVLFASTETVLAVAAASPYVVLTAPVLLLVAMFNARERMELEAVTEGVEGAVTLSLAIAVLATGGGIVGVMLALSAGRAVHLAVGTGLVRRLGGPVRVAATHTRWREMLALSLPIGLTRVFMAVIKRVDIVVLGLFVAAADVGTYSAAAVAVVLLIDLLSEMGRAAYPALSRARGPDDPRLHRAFAAVWQLQVLVSCSSAALVIVLADPVLPFVFGQEFVPAIPVVTLLAVGVPLRTIGHLAGVGLYAVDQRRPRAVVTGVSAAVKTVGCVALVPVLGVWGAALTSVLVDALYFLLMTRLARGFRPRIGPGTLAALAVAFVLVFAVDQVEGPAWVRVLVGSGMLAVLATIGLRRVVRIDAASRRLPAPAFRARIGPVVLAVEGATIADLDPGASVAVRAFSRLPRAGATDRPDLRIEFDTSTRLAGTPVARHPLVAAPGRIAAVDHASRHAILPLGDPEDVVRIDPRLDVHVFQTWVQLPLLRAALHRAGGMLARLTVVEVAGRRVALVAPSRTGKTRVVVELLRRGARLVGDDWTAVDAQGHVAAACPLMVVRDQAREALPGRAPATWIRRRLVVGLDGVARALRRWRRVAVAVNLVATLVWRWGARIDDVTSVVDGARMADEVAAVDLVVILGGDGTTSVADDIDALAETIAARGILDLPSVGILEAAYRAADPMGLEDGLVGTVEEERRLLRRVLAGAQMTVVDFHGDDESVARTVAHIEELMAPSGAPTGGET